MSDTTTPADARRWGLLITEAALIVASIQPALDAVLAEIDRSLAAIED